MTFLESAQKVLEEFGKGKPMHYGDITREAIDKGWLKTSGRTPEATMNAQLVTEIRKSESSGEPGRFARTSSGYYSLVQQLEPGLLERISNHNKNTREKLLFRIMNLSPGEFETLVQRLLVGMGFEDIEVTEYSHDGGVDVQGTLLISNVFRIKMAVQVKRWRDKVGGPIVQKLRGSLSAHERGLLITTSGFTKQAETEAAQKDKISGVDLVDGEQLLTLLVENDIGINRTSPYLFEPTELNLST